ncbi:MAG: hypothetical protein K0S12_1614 [Bacteroidetes bacterium]|jgi:hypothetical protein|nr:hypothetical protein [Bacteroidota bacterium]
MNLTDFNSLELSKKSDLVWEWGYYVATRKTGNHNVVLFLVSDFFAEVHITLADNKTEMIKGVSHADLHSDFIGAVKKDDPFIKAISSISKAPFTTAA